MKPSSRILINTLFLYGKTAISICIALFSTRYVLNALGVEDFGIYSLIGGVIAFLSFLNSAMSTSTQRFLSFHQKDKNNGILDSIFSSSFMLHFIIGILLVLIFEFCSMFLFSGFLNIDITRINSAKIVFHCMVVSTFFTIVSVPFDASITAHENLGFYAIVTLFESFGKLGIALFLYKTPFDRLETYGFLIAVLSIMVLIVKVIYCNINYTEIKINLNLVKKEILKKIAKYSIWTSLTALCSIIKNQGLTIILNLFCGVAVNAAYGIAKQVGGQTLFFSNVIFKASKPQIIGHISKKEQMKALDKTLSICKLSLILMSIFSIPLIMEMPYVLKLWLKNIPDYAISFCQLTLISMLVSLFSKGLNPLIEGVGNVKKWNIFSSLSQLLAFLIAYILLLYDFSPSSVFIGILTVDLLQIIITLYFATYYTDLTLKHYMTEIPLRFIPVICGTYFIVYKIRNLIFYEPFVMLILTVILSSICLSVLSFFALSAKEKNFAKGVWVKVRGKIGV